MKRLMRKFFVIGLTIVLCSSLPAEEIRLLPPQFENNVSLFEALEKRCTERSFSEKELSLQQLSNLLWAAAGVNRPDSEKRTAPTAHNDQEIDVYVAMKNGLYLYNAKDHVLDFIHANDIRRQTGKQKFTGTAPINLIYVSDYEKMKGDEESKKFYSATDTGFISQNVYLYCAAEGLATVVRGWVDREELAVVMNLRSGQHIVLAQTVGYTKQE